MTTATGNRTVQPYLFFNGRCAEALEFYQKVLGAEVQALMRFKDNPEPNNCGPAVTPEAVMHASFKIGESVLMASDGRCEGTPRFDGFSLSLAVATEAEAESLFAALGEGGKIEMPLTKTFFSARFGMVEDRFGMSWMILVTPVVE